MLKLKFTVSLLLLSLSVWSRATAFAQGTAFTYQGKLTDSGNLANGNYDFQFKLFDTATVGTGTQQGSTVAVPNITVTNGIFTVQLDFGVCAACFNGASRFLEIGVRPTGGGSFITLSPRQPITSTPYALKSMNAANATTADGLSVACVNCITSSQIQSVNGSAVTGTIPVASVPAGSTNYIQNQTAASQIGNFNISGNGTVGGTLAANIVNAARYNINGQPVLSVVGGTDCLFVGINAGSNGSCEGNSLFGAATGSSNTSGFHNSYFGSNAGAANTSGANNAFFGYLAGRRNTSGDSNAFFGSVAGDRNTIGQNNTFIGEGADFNTFNPTGDNNTLLGFSASINSAVSNSTAIGANALVTQSNSLILGSINGVNSATADTKVGIGTTTPDAVLDVQRDSLTVPEVARFTSYGNTANDILGRSSNGSRAAPTATPSGRPLLQLGATGHDGTGFATTARASIQLIASENWTPTAQGTNIRFLTTTNGTTTTSTRMLIADDGNIGIGTTAPLDKLDVNGDIRVGTGTTGCVKDSDGTVIAGNCSSDARLKRDITPFPHLLDKLLQLQPVHFYWRSAEFPDRHFGSAQSFGLVAQEVEKVMPELVREDAQGFQTVNYSKLPLLTLQAIKELKAENNALKEKLQKVEQQQAQIKTQATSIQQQQEQIKQQQLQISQQHQEVAAIKKLLCRSQPQADLCKAKARM